MKWFAEYNKKRYATPQGQALKAVCNAVLRGELIRPNRCSSCLKKSDIIEAHHKDYSKPLAVKWLCRACHAAVHRKRGSVKR